MSQQVRVIQRPLIGNRVTLMEDNLRRVEEVKFFEANKDRQVKVKTKVKAQWQKAKIVFAGKYSEAIKRFNKDFLIEFE